MDIDAFFICVACPPAGLAHAIANAPASKYAAKALDNLFCITLLLAE
jgi:hypothetical protein